MILNTYSALREVVSCADQPLKNNFGGYKTMKRSKVISLVSCIFMLILLALLVMFIVYDSDYIHEPKLLLILEIIILLFMDNYKYVTSSDKADHSIMKFDTCYNYCYYCISRTESGGLAHILVIVNIMRICEDGNLNRYYIYHSIYIIKLNEEIYYSNRYIAVKFADAIRKPVNNSYYISVFDMLRKIVRKYRDYYKGKK